MRLLIRACWVTPEAYAKHGKVCLKWPGMCLCVPQPPILSGIWAVFPRWLLKCARREQHWFKLHQSLLLVATFSSVSQPCHLPCFVEAIQLLIVKACKDMCISLACAMMLPDLAVVPIVLFPCSVFQVCSKHWGGLKLTCCCLNRLKSPNDAVNSTPPAFFTGTLS